MAGNISDNVNLVRLNQLQNKKAAEEVKKAEAEPVQDRSEQVMSGLNSLANINRVAVTSKKEAPKFELNLSTEELEKRTSKDALPTTTMLKPDAPEYQKLAAGDKEALKHLVKAGKILENIHLKLDNENNIPFRNFLEEKVAQGDKNAEMSLKLFKAQKGMNAIDTMSEKINLAKGIKVEYGYQVCQLGIS